MMSPNANDVANRLHSAAIHLLRAVAREDAQSGLSAPRLSALSVVVFRGPLTLGELAAAEGVRPPTMTRTVQGLEQEGLVRRKVGADRRTSLVSATPRGRQVLGRARERRVERLARALRELPAGELAGLDEAANVIERVSRAGSAG